MYAEDSLEGLGDLKSQPKTRPLKSGVSVVQRYLLFGDRGEENFKGEASFGTPTTNAE